MYTYMGLHYQFQVFSLVVYLYGSSDWRIHCIGHRTPTSLRTGLAYVPLCLLLACKPINQFQVLSLNFLIIEI